MRALLLVFGAAAHLRTSSAGHSQSAQASLTFTSPSTHHVSPDREEQNWWATMERNASSFFSACSNVSDFAVVSGFRGLAPRAKVRTGHAKPKLNTIDTRVDEDVGRHDKGWAREPRKGRPLEGRGTYVKIKCKIIN